MAISREATAAEVIDKTRTIWGTAVDLTSRLAARTSFALRCTSGIAYFIGYRGSSYKICLCLDENYSGRQTKQDILDAFQWMFDNTDAVEMFGYIDKANAPCLAMVPQTRGYTMEDAGDSYIYRVTRRDFLNTASPARG
jgi:hypothetical protein